MRITDGTMKELGPGLEKTKRLKRELGSLDTTLTKVAKTVEQTAKTVKNAGKVTKAVATLLDFDEINRLVEKTVSAAKSTQQEETKEKTGPSRQTNLERKQIKGLKGFDTQFWTQFGYSSAATMVEPSFWEKVWAEIWPFIDTFRDACDERDGKFSWIDREDLLGIGAKLITTPGELWAKFKQGWGAPAVDIGNGLTNSGASLWKGFRGQWGSRSVTIGNGLASPATTLWKGFSKGWGERKVTIVNTLANTASSLWTLFKSGWSGKTLALKITYSTSVGAIKTAVYKALGLSGWPTLSFAARGGIVESATLFGNTVVGEAGKEAIIPLENHTEWLDMVAERLSGSAQPIVVQVTLDGRIVGQSTVNYIRAEARAGRDPLAGAV